jgi:hypothetical protein
VEDWSTQKPAFQGGFREDLNIGLDFLGETTCIETISQLPQSQVQKVTQEIPVSN